MRHTKLYKKLTLGQKILTLALILTLNVFLGSTEVVLAEDAPSTDAVAATDAALNRTTLIRPDGTIELNVGPNPQTSITNSCERIERDLDTRLRAMARSCSATSLSRGCMEGLFRCDESSDSENCTALNSITSAPPTETARRRLDEQREELKELQEQRTETLESQRAAQQAIDTLNESLESKRMEIEALDDELRSTIQSNDRNTQARLTETQTAIRTLEESNRALSGQIAEQQTQMIQFMTAARLQCNQQAQQHAQRFYTTARACTSGRGNCNLSLNAVLRNGNRSLAEMAQAYARTKRRECLRVDGQNDFAVQFRAMSALQQNHQRQIAEQQAQIARNREALIGQIQIAQASGQIANAEANLRRAERASRLSDERGRIQTQLNARNAEHTRINRELASLQNQISAKSEEIAGTRRSITSSMSSGELNSLRESQLLASGLLAEAQDARTTGCECAGAIRNISNLSGANLCDNPSAEIETAPTDELVEFDDGVA